MPLHPMSRQLYRQLLEVARYHPTVTVEAVRETARVEFYRRGESDDPEMIKRAIAYGRKQLRHLRNGMTLYNASRGGALEEDWALLNARQAQDALTSRDGRVKYVPLRNVPRAFRTALPAAGRSAPLSIAERERLGLIGMAPEAIDVPALAAAAMDPTPTRLDKSAAVLSSAAVTEPKGIRRGERPRMEFNPENTVPFGVHRHRGGSDAVDYSEFAHIADAEATS